MSQRLPILLVEDDLYTLNDFKKALETDQTSEFTYHVVTAQSRQEALEKANRVDFRLVITDVRLAGEYDRSGLQLGIEMNQRGIPVIVMTRTDKFAEIREAADAQQSPDIHAEFNLYDKADFTTMPNSLAQRAEVAIKGRTVFIVHGHDHVVLKEVEKFVESHRYKPVILWDEPGSGKSILDNLIAYSNVRYTIVLMTPDDVGGKRLDGVADYRIDRNPEAPARLAPRARQNVIFELGYFIGKHGASRVSALVIDGMEIPSDYGGIKTTSYENNDWRKLICKEMRRAGLDVDCP